MGAPLFRGESGPGKPGPQKPVKPLLPIMMSVIALGTLGWVAHRVQHNKPTAPPAKSAPGEVAPTGVTMSERPEKIASSTRFVSRMTAETVDGKKVWTITDENADMPKSRPGRTRYRIEGRDEAATQVINDRIEQLKRTYSRTSHFVVFGNPMPQKGIITVWNPQHIQPEQIPPQTTRVTSQAYRVEFAGKLYWAIKTNSGMKRIVGRHEHMTLEINRKIDRLKREAGYREPTFVVDGKPGQTVFTVSDPDHLRVD